MEHFKPEEYLNSEERNLIPADNASCAFRVCPWMIRSSLNSSTDISTSVLDCSLILNTVYDVTQLSGLSLRSKFIKFKTFEDEFVLE